MDSASFYQLWQDPKSALGETLLKQSEVQISPGENKTIKISKVSGANYLAAVAIFRTPGLTDWKAVMSISKAIPMVPKSVTINLVKNRITMH